MFALSKLEWLVLALALLLFPELTWGQADARDAGSGASAAAPAASLFDRLDRNKDGYLSREELASEEAQRRNWIAVDRDRDGRISRSEFGLVGIAADKPQPGAAAGGTRPEKKPE